MDDPIIHSFRERFRREPEFIVRAPGRINLIGEHTDYNGFPVLPISIPFSVRVAAAGRRDGVVRIENRDPVYPPASFSIGKNTPPSPPGAWENYVKAAAAQLASVSHNALSGMDALFDGDIPSSAGLSSSSALVIAAALALCEANDLRFDRTALAEMMAEGERYVGTQGGGMDQAVCLLGEPGAALRIDFFPLRHAAVPFPEGFTVVAAHSLVRAAKTENALLLYNRRPAECRLATALINGLHAPDPPMNRLGDLPQTGLIEKCGGIREFIDLTFPEESYSLSRIAELAGRDGRSIAEHCLLTRSGALMPEPEDGFRLRSRALHVLTEAGRVEESCAALTRGDAHAFGRLMNESHESCDQWYGISTPELNALVRIMREAGAFGARLTGAGFGGCAVALVSDSGAERLINEVGRRYYDLWLPETRPDLSGDGIIFSAKPAGGASIHHLPEG